jgi:hypothetical protein
MKRFTTILNAMMLCAAPVAMAQSGAGRPLALTSAQMDGVTAGQASVPAASAAAAAAAVGGLALTNMNASTSVSVSQSPAQPVAALGTTVSSASGFAFGTGPAGQSSVGTSVVSEQPLSANNVVGTTIQWNVTIGGLTMGASSQMTVGGYPIGFFNQAFGTNNPFK